jgi:GDP-L-fucose synthase
MLLVQSQAYRQQYNFHAIYLIPVNLYGPRDNFDLDEGHVIPAIIRKCVDAVGRGEREIVCWGDGTPTREFLYVEDCADAIMLATEHYDGVDPVNIGAGVEISIRDLAGLIAELTEFKGRITWDTSRPNGQPRRCLDTRRARELFGFQATTDLRSGLQRTIAWYLGQNRARTHPFRVHAWNE